MGGADDGGEFVAPLVRGAVLAAREPLPRKDRAARAAGDEKLVNRVLNMGLTLAEFCMER
jgi:hypothetical protein